MVAVGVASVRIWGWVSSSVDPYDPYTSGLLPTVDRYRALKNYQPSETKERLEEKLGDADYDEAKADH